MQLHEGAMSDDDRTLGGLPSNRARAGTPDDRPTARIELPRDTRRYIAPRAIGIDEAKRMAADILTGADGMRRAGPRGIEELAWFVARIDPASVIDRADDMATADLAIDDPAAFGAEPVIGPA